MKTLNSIEQSLMEKIAANKKEIEVCTKKILEAEQTAQKADDELKAAETDVNLEKYKEAKDSIWSAKHAKELYQKQKEKLVSDQLISRNEYHQLLSEITTIADAAHEEQNSRAVALIAELRNISEESSQTWQRTNALLHLLQREVYKEPEGKISNGDGTTTWSADKEYKNYETVHNFYQNNIASTSMAKRAGEIEPKQRIKSWA